jgi:peptidyl-prolyl cis-trans isomerase A (cyclophilin A)
MNKVIAIIVSLVFFSCKGPGLKNPHIAIVTPLGDIEVELYPQQAPKTVAAFLSYVDSGFYTNSSFYRVIMSEGLTTSGNVGLVQGGIYQTNDQLHPAIPGIEHESTQLTGLTHSSGTISLARTSPGTANTEFFICIGDQHQFDYGNQSSGDSLGFAAFGKVVKGMPVARKIQEQPKNGEHFTRAIQINSIERIR